MESSVFFKFKSQKEPTRVQFDGTGISVFELKRDIIIKSGLGDGTDFDLAIYTDDGKEEYDDDTTIIPRSTTVIARRLPPMKPGAGRAARYVSGKMPVNAKNQSRREQTTKAASTRATSDAIAQMNNAMTEEEKLAAMFQLQSDQFAANQEDISHQAPTFKSGAKKPANVPDHDPPQGYVCYRCGEKGHWIQLCPTNDNPEFDNRPRVKRTTGIPRSFLKTVDKATALAQHGADGDDSKTPSGIMVNADGEYVIAEPDKASWEQFQAKAKSTTQKSALQIDKEAQELGLECPVDHRMFIDPMKTPCCAKTYCNDCITNALIESDFVCPSCQQEGVLIDDLTPDDEAADKIKKYLADKESKAKEASKSPAGSPKSPTPNDAKPADDKAEQTKASSKSPTPNVASVKSPQSDKAQASTKSPTPATSTIGPASTNGDGNSKKRPAEDAAENTRIPKAPKAMQKAQQQPNMMDMMGMPMNPNMPGMGMPMMPFPGMPMMNGMPMPMPMGMGMGMGMNNMNMNMGFPNPMMNPMMPGGGMPNFNMNGGGGFGGMPNFGMNGMPMGSGPGGPMNGGGMSGMNGMNGMNNQFHGNGGGFQHNNHNNFHQQQQGFQPGRNFTNQPAGDEDAYFRKPVNPQRHQNRVKRARPSDYREL